MLTNLLTLLPIQFVKGLNSIPYENQIIKNQKKNTRLH